METWNGTALDSTCSMQASTHTHGSSNWKRVDKTELSLQSQFRQINYLRHKFAGKLQNWACQTMEESEREGRGRGMPNEWHELSLGTSQHCLYRAKSNKWNTESDGLPSTEKDRARRAWKKEKKEPLPQPTKAICLRTTIC